MKLRHSILAFLALTMIPTGMALTSSDNAQDIEAYIKEIKLKKADAAATPAKPLTTWEKIKKKLAWFNVNRVLGITGVVLLGWMIKRQFFSPDSKGGRLNPFGPRKIELEFRKGYRRRLAVPGAPDGAPVVIQGPNGRQIIIEQVAVVEQYGPSCPYHSSVNADILAQAEINEKNRDAERAKAKDPQYAGQRIEAAAEHVEKALNSEAEPARGDLFKASRSELRESTSEAGWAEAEVVQELLARSPGNAQVVSFQDGAPQHDEASLKQNGVHRVVVAYQGARNVAMGKHAIHYFTVVINRQDNSVRYVVADSMGNPDRRQTRAVDRLISHLEWNDSSNEGVNHVYQAVGNAIAGRAPAAGRAQAPRRAAPGANEVDLKKLDNGPAPAAAAPKPAAQQPAPQPVEPARGQTHAPAATATATPTASAAAAS